jgi:hypothetical protein
MTDTTFSKAASLATIATAVIAVAALCIAVWQIRVGQQTQREASARDAFKEYLKLAMEKPELAEPSLGTVSDSGVESSRYSWFVSYFLFSAEQIHLSFPNDSEWSAALSNQICYHREYLKGSEYQKTLKTHYARSFVAFVDQSISHCQN